MSISFSPSTALAATTAIYITLEPKKHPKDVVQAAWEVKHRFDAFATLFNEYRSSGDSVSLLRVRTLHRDVVLAVRALEKLLGVKLTHEG